MWTTVRVYVNPVAEFINIYTLFLAVYYMHVGRSILRITTVLKHAANLLPISSNTASCLLKPPMISTPCICVACAIYSEFTKLEHL